MALECDVLTRRRRHVLMCCNGCRLAIGDRNTIRTTVVFRSVSDRVVLCRRLRTVESEREISPHITYTHNGVYTIMIRPRAYMHQLHPGRQDAHIRARRAALSRSPIVVTSRAYESNACESESHRADVYSRFRVFVANVNFLIRRAGSTIINSVLLHFSDRACVSSD
ncbi:hypothetical protein ACS0PU_011814 [Formica fusca]